MKKLLTTLFILISTTLWCACALADTQRFDVLCYHDIKDNVDGDLEQESNHLSTQNLARHFAWLQAHGYHPISIDDLLAAQSGKKPLPEKSVLLTFDDGYQSFYTRVFPLLKLYQYPAVSALVGSWMATDITKFVQYGDKQLPRSHFMSDAQIKEISTSGLVEFASHSYALHHGTLANPQGNTKPAATTLQYDVKTGKYESLEDYRQRIQDDLNKNSAYLKSLTGKAPRVMVWPYGEHNAITREAAQKAGMNITFTLSEENIAKVDNLQQVGRLLIDANPNEKAIVQYLNHETPIDKQRVMHVDLDYVYDNDPAQTERNLGILLERVKSLEPSTVYLQAFADENGDGVAESVYFPNRHVTMRADLFSRVAWQLRTRTGVQVYAWMPVLAFELKDKSKQQSLQVVSANPKADKQSYRRLSPFSSEARQVIKEIYSDLAAHTNFAGILFHDDAVLSENEDNSAYALAIYQSQLQLTGIQPLSFADATRLAQFKSRWLTDFTLELATELKKFHPQLKTARNLYATAMLNPESEHWLSQNYVDFLASYDYTAVMAMPFLEKAENPEMWLKSLIDKAKSTNHGLRKTIFELQARDWVTKQPLGDSVLSKQLQTLQDAGANHVGYYPDDFLNNQPSMEMVRPYISARNFPYLPQRN